MCIRDSAGFRRVIVVLQFSLSFLLIIFTLIVGSQLKFLQHGNLGLDINNIGHFRFNGIRNETLKAELASNPDILSTTIEAPDVFDADGTCLLYTSPSPRDRTRSRMPSSA